MLKWKPATTRDSILAMQELMISLPRVMNPKQCHYFVTEADIAVEAGVTPDQLSPEIVNTVLSGTGLDPKSTDIQSAALPHQGTYGFFVAEQALHKAGIRLPPWERPGMSSGDRDKSATR